MDRSIVLQIINGYVSVFAFCGLFIFLRYLYRTSKEGYTKRIQAGLAILCLCLGTVVLRGPLFVIRTLANSGQQVHEPLWIYGAGGTLLGIAFLCIIRVFSPDEWRNKPWIIALILGTIVVVASLFYVKYWSVS